MTKERTDGRFVFSVALVAGAESLTVKSVSGTLTHACALGASQCLYSHRKLMSYHQKMCEEHS